ncbi:phage holin family protein [Tropicimonas sp. IMCC34043]|uniref:phage holin family protein n=1 Tax=Tropicimonas sp. IMCC34043 TaxID=2248760 RepID=UPI0013001DD0|nr:phage holin family protein [Tropicimonas sp. IMCC34043]
MKKMLISALVFLLANAIGLLVAMFFLVGFTTNFGGFFLAVVLLSVVEALAGPLLENLSKKNLPAMQGSVTLIATFLGLFFCDLLLSGFQISGLNTWLLSVLIVWLVALVAGLALPKLLAKWVGPRTTNI